MKTTKRLLSFFLCLALLLPIIPIGVFSAFVPVYSLNDGYIKVDVSRENGGFLIATAEGNRLKKSDNNKNLLYHNGEYDTSFVSFRVGEGGSAKEYIFGGTYPTSTGVNVTQSGENIVATWGVDGITFTETLSLATENSDEHGMVSISLAYSGTSEPVKARVLLDTCLGNQDYAFYQVNGGTLVSTLRIEQTLTDPLAISAFYAVDDISDPAIVARMISTPYQVSVGHWNNLSSTLFDFAPNNALDFTNTINEYLTADSACALYYEMNTASPVTLYYGVYSNAKVDISQSVAVNTVSPMRLNLSPDKKSFVKEDGMIGSADFAVRISAENFVSDTSVDYQNVILAISSTSGLRPLGENGEPVSGMEYDSIDPLTVPYTRFDQNTTIEKTVYFQAALQAEASYERITVAVYKNSQGGELIQQNLLGQKVIYILVPGADGNVPMVHFNSMSPSIVYSEGTRHLYAAAARADLFENALRSGKCEVFAVTEDGKKSFKLDTNTITFNEGVADLVLDDNVKLPVGKCRIELRWTDDAVSQNIVTKQFQTQTAEVLKFTVSDDPKYRNDSYGVLAAVKYGVFASTDDPVRYVLMAFKDEADFKNFSEKKAPYESETYKEIVLVFRGAFVGDKRYKVTNSTGAVIGYRYYTAVSKKTVNNETRETHVDNTITINNCLDFEGGTMSVYYEDYAKGEAFAKQSAILCEFDGDLYTSVERSSVWTGKAALTKLEQGKDFALITYDKNGNRTNKNSTADPVTLIWPNVYGYGQMLAGMIFKLAYGQFGVMKDGNKEIGRVIGFSASLSLSFMRSPEDNDIDEGTASYFGRMKELWTDWRGASIYQYAYHGSRFEKLTDLKMSDEDTSGDNDKGVKASVMVPDILFGCGEGFIGLNFTVEVAIKNMIEGLPSISGKLSINTINDWAFGLEGVMKLTSFKLEAKLSFKSKDNIPIPDEIYFFMGGFKPGINLDGAGVVWLTGAGGGVSNIYDTIFMTSGLPPLKLILAASFSIVQILDGMCKLELSLTGINFSATDIKILETITVLKSVTLGLQWYPKVKLQASIYVDMFEKTISGNGYIVLDQKDANKWVFEMFARARLCIPESVPLVGGMTLLGADIGIGTEKIWGALEVLKISLGITYFWGESGVHFGTGGDYAQPSYPSLLKLQGYDGRCEDIPIAYDEKEDRMLYAHIGTNFDPPEGAQILSDGELRLLAAGARGVWSTKEKTRHMFNLGTYDSENLSTMVQVNFPATSLDDAKATAQNFWVNSKDDNTGDALPLTYAQIVRAQRDDETDEAYEAEIAPIIAANADANANITYNGDTGLGTFGFTLTDASQFGKDWYISTGTSQADVVLYNVHALPQLTDLTIAQGTEGGEDVFNVTWTGINTDDLDKISFYLTETNNDPIEKGIPLDTLDYVSGNSDYFFIPADLPTGDYYLRAVYSKDEQINGVVWSSSTVHYTNPNSPADMGTPSVTHAGDYKYLVSVPASADANTKGYIVSIFNEDGTPTQFTDMLFDKAETGATTFEVGGVYTMTTHEDPEDPESAVTTVTVGLEEGKHYRISVTPYNSVHIDDSTPDMLLQGTGFSYTDTAGLPHAETPDVTLRKGSEVLKSVAEMAYDTGNVQNPDEIPTFTGSDLTFNAEFSEYVTGTWTLDGNKLWDSTNPDDAPDLPMGTFAGTSAEIALTGLTEGGHQLTITGKAADGDSFAAEYSFNVDTTAPRLLLNSPLSGSPFNSDGTVTIAGITDPGATIYVSINGAAAVSFAPVTDADDLFTHTVAIPGYNDASVHSLRIWAVDANGNSTEPAEIQVSHPGLGTMTDIVIKAGDAIPADGGIGTETGVSNMQLTLMAKTPDGTQFALDPDLVRWDAVPAEGNVSVTTSGVLNCDPFSRGFVQAKYEVSTGAYITSVLALGLEGNDVTVTYTTGGTASGGGTYAVGETVELTASPASGYRLTGWTLNGVTVSDTSLLTISFAMPDNAVTAHAEFVVDSNTIDFDLNGGEGTAPASQTLGYGSTVTRPEDPVRTGWKFAGWYEGDRLWDFTNDKVTASITLTAHWTQKNPITPVVSIEGWTYGETAKAPELSGNDGNGSVTWEYKLKSADDSEYSTDVPQNAGEYTVRAKVAETAEYAAASDTEDFEISKAEVPSPTIPSATYTGSPQTAEVPASPLYTVTSNSGGTAAGNYSVVLTLTDPANYKWADSSEANITLTFSVTTAATSPDDITEPAISAVTYDPDGKLSDIALPAGWEWAEPDTVPTASVGSYRAVYGVDDTNYDWSGVPGYDPANHCIVRDIPVTINKAEVPVPAVPSKAFTGELLTADLATSSLYTVTSNPGGTQPGEYNVNLRLVDPDNYKWSDADTDWVQLKFSIIAWTGPVWTWSSDKTSATARFTNSADNGGEQTVNSTISSEPNGSGGTKYTAKITFMGTEYTDIKQTYPYMKGDIDVNGVINLDDVILLLKHNLFPDLYPIEYAGDPDLSEDGSFDIGDVVLLLQHYLFPQYYPLD